MTSIKTDREQYDQACRMAAHCANRAEQADQKNERDFYIRMRDSWMKVANFYAPRPSTDTRAVAPRAIP